MTPPTAIDGSDGPLVVRRIVVWRRLEPGDARTPGCEIAPESEHLEARVVEVGIARDLFDDLERLQAKHDEVTRLAARWSRRYEPAGVLFTIGGSMVIGAWLEYLPAFTLPFAASLVLLGVAVGVVTKVLKSKSEREAERRWRAMPEKDELAAIEARLTPRWARFAERLREDTGFRADVRVGDIHEADRLVSLDPTRITHPDSWRPDPKPAQVRYGWRYADGRVVEKEAELEDTDEPDPLDGAEEDRQREGDDTRDDEDEDETPERPARRAR